MREILSSAYAKERKLAEVENYASETFIALFGSQAVTNMAANVGSSHAMPTSNSGKNANASIEMPATLPASIKAKSSDTASTTR